MSMIKCTECGKEISDKATACPHCGCPMTEILSATKENKKEEKVKPIKEKKIKEPITPEQKKKRILIMSVTAFVLFAAVALIWYFGIKILHLNSSTECGYHLFVQLFVFNKVSI